MTILQAMDGKFYDVPDDQAAAFEVPREKVKELLEKAGMPAPQGGQEPSHGGAPSHGPGNGHAPGPQQGGGGMPNAPVVVQIFAAQPTPGMSGPPQGQHQGGQHQGAPPGQQAPEGEGDVNPYWWWRNITWVRPWYNGWGNWGNW